MKDKRILVTGAASGIGRAVVDRLVAEGAQVEALDRDASSLDDLCAGGRSVRPIAADVSDAAAIRQAMTGVPLDGVVNAAGLGPDHADVEAIFLVNLRGTLEVIEAVRANLAAGSSIVNISSVAGMFADDALDSICVDPASEDFPDRVGGLGLSTGAAYEYSKRAVVRHTQRLATELAPVRVNVVSPGHIMTPMGIRGLPWAGRIQSRAPLQRSGEPHEVAAMVRFLLSEDASYVSGANFVVDGGFSAYATARLERRSHPEVARPS